MAKYKIFSGYGGSPQDDYHSTVNVPSGIKVGDWLEANGYGEAYNYDWELITVSKKPKQKKRSVSKAKKNYKLIDPNTGNIFTVMAEDLYHAQMKGANGERNEHGFAPSHYKRAVAGKEWKIKNRTVKVKRTVKRKTTKLPKRWILAKSKKSGFKVYKNQSLTGRFLIKAVSSRSTIYYKTYSDFKSNKGVKF